ncbi:MAG: quercetin dioxygenase-like cupin family protein [Psychromonas sp.]|jgi:quercetin dioxygenase-like cupin family protein|uniref:cupin domain-containing protein n=1 Tax=Psychromonas sp. TaxID=1884585 RepID=UPI0039E68E08
MQITRFEDAKPYDAPKHYNMLGLRLQGFDASLSENFWVGLSQFLPGGGAEMDSSPLEKVYIVLSGEITITLGNGEETILKAQDSCFLAPNEARAIENRSNTTAHMYVIMNYPKGYDHGPA